jgi:cephalosporin hydroxylase
MRWDAQEWEKQRRRWSSLSALHSTPIDLARIGLIRGAGVDELSDARALETLVVRLGLNDEALAEIPAELRPHAGQGLRIWQYPNQFGPYLAHLSRLRIRSYLEIGIRHGGSFVATAEVLERLRPLDFAIGVDVIPCPSMTGYRRLNEKADFWCLSTLSPEFRARLDELGAVDLVFIDSHHEEEQCRLEWELLVPRAGAIAFHDIANVGCPGVGRVWQEIKRSPEFACFEYVAQYAGLGPPGAAGPFMGIGLAVKRARLALGAPA